MYLNVKFKNYRDDSDNYIQTKIFYSLEELGDYLYKEAEERAPSRTSVWWSNPADTNKEGRGWYRLQGIGKHYSLWLREVKTNEGITIFEEGKYTSPKFYEFLKKLHDRFEEKPIYGDI